MCVCLGVQPYSPSVSPHITVEPLLLPWITPSLAEPASVRENAVSIFLQNCHKLQINQLSSCAWLKNWRKLEDAQPTCALLKTEKEVCFPESDTSSMMGFFRSADTR